MRRWWRGRWGRRRQIGGTVAVPAGEMVVERAVGTVAVTVAVTVVMVVVKEVETAVETVVVSAGGTVVERAV